MRETLNVFFLLFSVFIPASDLNAQVDASTLLYLPFENSTNGVQGEVPTVSSGLSYQQGVVGQGVLLPAGNQLRFQSVNNISSLEGTMEFWIKPSWNGNDGRHHTFLDWNTSGFRGMGLDKHDQNEVNFALDTNANWKEVQTNVSDWQANRWHHIAVTWSNTTKKVELYLDGRLTDQYSFQEALQVSQFSSFTIGANRDGTRAAEAVIDEFYISNRARTATEIAARYISVLNITSISLSSVTKTLWPTWRIPFTVNAQTNVGPLTLPASGLTLESSDPAKAFLGTDGLIHAVAPGSVNLTVSVHQVQTTVPFGIRPPMRPPSVATPTGFRSLPATGGLYKMPVVSLRYVPTSDGVNVDLTWAPWFGTSPISIAELESNMDKYDEIRKFGLEEGSRFRDYGNRTQPPSLSYQVIANITVYEPPPPGELVGSGETYTLSEMKQMFERLNMQEYVENRGAKEIWYWGPQLGTGYPGYNPAIHPPENFRGYPESNMASPTTSDISNSFRQDFDLPIYSHTYIVIGIHNRRFDNLTLHVDGHQQESILQYINNLQDNNTDLFRKKFIGDPGSGGSPRGRAGDTHSPPNADFGYDYNNFTPVESDIRDWRPDGTGQKIMYSAATVRDTPYVFPNSFLGSNRNEPHWYIFWRQSLPGYGNTIPYQVGPVSYRMTNWWQFTGDWDRANRAGVGLYEPALCSYGLSATSQSFPATGGGGTVSVMSSSGCKWFASNNAMWTPLTSGDIGNGSGTVSFTVQPNMAATTRRTTVAVAGQPFTIDQQAAQPLVSIGGRVTTPTGLGLRNAVVSLTDSLGTRRTATTSSFGVYSFADVPGGGSYIVTVTSKRYRFSARTLVITTNLTDIDFLGLE